MFSRFFKDPNSIPTEWKLDHLKPINEENDPFFLKGTYLLDCQKKIGFSDQLYFQLVDNLEIFRLHPELTSLILHLHRLHFIEENIKSFTTCPEMDISLHKNINLFYAYFCLSGMPFLIEKNRKLGITETITYDTLKDILIWTEDYQVRNGRLGFNKLIWLNNHFFENLYKCGRLQFQPLTYAWAYQAFRHKKKRRVILLSNKSCKFDEHGFYSENGKQQTAYHQEHHQIQGNYIDPHGKFTDKKMTLNLNDWECILKTGEQVLAFHIPATGPLDIQECQESFKQILKIYEVHFPEKKIKALVSYSWMFDQQLRDYLSPNSNLIQFQNFFYTAPNPSQDESDIFYRIFPQLDNSLPEYPNQGSRLQKAAVQHVQDGKKWNFAMTYIFPEEISLNNFQHYIRKIPLD